MYWDITREIIAAFYTVKHELGPGFHEHVYANATAVVLRENGLRAEREVPYEVVFHGVAVGTCRADIIVESVVLVEVKVAKTIIPAHREQAWHYLKAAKLQVGMVLNYGARTNDNI